MFAAIFYFHCYNDAGVKSWYHPIFLYKIAPFRCYSIAFFARLSIIKVKGLEGGIDMAQATFSVRMDETLKRQFDALCADFGMSATTAFNVFARAVVRERKIPFEIQASNNLTRADEIKTFLELRSQAQENNIEELSLDEMSEEITKAAGV